jgi:hypothetical protein
MSLLVANAVLRFVAERRVPLSALERKVFPPGLRLGGELLCEARAVTPCISWALEACAAPRCAMTGHRAPWGVVC